MTNELTIIQPGSLATLANLPLDRNPAAVYLGSLRESGRRTQRLALDTIASILGFQDAYHCPWWELRYQHTATIRAQLADHYKYSYGNKMLVALRRVLRECYKLGLMSAEDYQRAIMFDTITGSDTTTSGREVTPLELAALFQTCQSDPTPPGIRDAALFVVLYPGGLRREETVYLDVSCYDRTVHELTVHGKRNKTRTVPFEDSGAILALDDWLALRGDSAGALFVPIRKNGKLALDRRLNNQSVYDILKKRTQEAGLESFSPHDLRRSVGTHLLESGADVLTVARYLGHSNVQTTGRYDKRGLKAMKKAAAALHVPYQGRELG